MDKIKLEILGLSSSQSQAGSFALVLGEADGHRRLPIIIGGFEAQAIALEIENIKPNRPMTHDLLVSIANTFGIEMIEVVISELKEGVFYSKILFRSGTIMEEIDARPSDAIAIAVRFKAPIFTTEEILQEAGIVVRENRPENPTPNRPHTVPESAIKHTPEENIDKKERIKRLNELIERHIQNEDYEKAAQLRDEINKIENEL